MRWVFAIIDKSGRKIHLSSQRWAHIHKHPEMMNQLEQMKDALVHPDKIIEFDVDPAVRFYYRYDKTRQAFLLVSVKYLNGEGFVITSFYTDKIR